MSAFELLGGAYFYQTWSYDYPTPEAVVAHFLDDEPESVVELLTEVDRLIASDLSESQLDDVLDKAGFCYSPRLDGRTNRGWLEVVAAMSARRVLRLPPEHD
ncbi:MULTISPECIES: contact-dependent growth inhibition system immunity protein [Nocardioides]|uniref:contact-dependent growth inhibition system immunity protein n=1 Tax=Nocardioides TaxID=1839 RepID=UPI001E454620|nr:contact-dependent growth inhibition system immunity protein [Nocardioides sp. Leaf374]